MTQSGFSNAVNDAVALCVASIGAVLAAAVKDLGDKPVSVKAEGFDLPVTVSPKSGLATVGAETLSSITDLLAVAKGIHNLLGSSAPVNPEPPIELAPQPTVQ